jgi:hypothetical protein
MSDSPRRATSSDGRAGSRATPTSERKGLGRSPAAPPEEGGLHAGPGTFPLELAKRFWRSREDCRDALFTLRPLA